MDHEDPQNRVYAGQEIIYNLKYTNNLPIMNVGSLFSDISGSTTWTGGLFIK